MMMLPVDPYTWETRLCDDEGIVGNEVAFQSGSSPNLTLTYLDIHNNMRRHTRDAEGLTPEPFHCTGSAHLAGEHIRCTSPAHKGNRLMSEASHLLLAGPAPADQPERCEHGQLEPHSALLYDRETGRPAPLHCPGPVLADQGEKP